MSDGAAEADRSSRARGYLKSTAKHGGVYMIGAALARLSGLIMLPVYTHILTPSDYGILEILGYTTDILSMIAGLGVSMAVLRYYYRFETEDERRAIVSTASLLVFAIFATVALVGIVVASPASLLLLGRHEPHLVRLAVISLATGALIDVPMIVMRARQSSGSVVVAGQVRLLLALAFNVVFVVWLRVGVAGVLYSNIISALLVGGYLVFALFRESGIRFSGPMARQLVAFGMPFVFWQVGSFVLHFSDRFFLRATASLTAVGLYSLSYKLALLLPMLISSPFGSIWLPKALEIDKNEGERAPAMIASIQRHFVVVLVSLAFGLALFGGDIIRIVAGPSFHGAAPAVPVLALAMVFFGFRQTSQLGPMIREQPGLIARGTTVAAIVVLLLNALLIPRYGLMGAAVATLGAFAFEFFFTRAMSMRVYPMAVETGVVPITVAFVVWLTALLVVPADAPLVVTISSHTAAYAVYLGGLVVTGALAPEQRRFLVDALRNPIRSIRALKGA